MTDTEPTFPAAGRPVDDLVAAGLARPPGRRDRPAAPPPEQTPVDMRPDGVLDELRGQ